MSSTAGHQLGAGTSTGGISQDLDGSVGTVLAPPSYLGVIASSRLYVASCAIANDCDRKTNTGWKSQLLCANCSHVAGSLEIVTRSANTTRKTVNPDAHTI